MEGGERASFSGSTRESGPEGTLKECQFQSSTPSPGDSSGGGDVAPPGSGMMIGISSGSRSRDQDTARKNLGDGSRSTGSMALSMTSPSSSLPLFPPPPLINTVTSSSEYFLSQKRGRGRPPGSGNRQLLATLGEWFAHSAGGNFTPHVVTIAAGEDVAARIMSFSQKGPRGICILSANGAISNVALRQPGSSGGTLTYEGRFEILSLSGSFTITESNGVRSRTGGISVSLAGPDGRVVGGGVAGLLLAASPIQVVVGSFLPNTLKEHRKRYSTNPESWNGLLSSGNGKPHPIMPQQINHDDHECETPTSTTASNPNLVAAGWHGLQHSSAERHEPSPDINLSLPPGQ